MTSESRRNQCYVPGIQERLSTLFRPQSDLEMIAIFGSSKFIGRCYSNFPSHGAGMAARALSLRVIMRVETWQIKKITDKLLFVCCGSWSSEKLAVDTLNVREAIFGFNQSHWRSIAAEAPPQRKLTVFERWSNVNTKIKSHRERFRGELKTIFAYHAQPLR